MPKKPRHFFEELDEASESFNPGKKEIKDDLQREEMISRDISDLHYALSRTRSTNPFRTPDTYFEQEDEIQHPESLLAEVGRIRREIRQVRDRRTRAALEKRMEGMEEHAIHQFEPYLSQQVFRAGSFFFSAAEDPERFQVGMRAASLRTKSELRDAMQTIQRWKLNEEQKQNLLAIVSFEAERFEQYEGEPYLWGCEEAIRRAESLLQTAQIADIIDRENRAPRLGREEEYLQIPEELQETLAEIERYKDKLQDPDLRAWMQKCHQSLTQSVDRLMSARREHTRSQDGDVPEGIIGGRAWACRVLGVPESVTADDIRKAYRKQVIATHPDRQPPEKQSEATEKMTKLNRAMHILSALSQSKE